MNKKSHKKKNKKRSRGDGRNKENIPEPETEEQPEPPPEPEPCYEVKHSEVMGRYLVARRDIRAGEVVMEAPALAVGPCAGCPLVCLGCYRELPDTALYKANVHDYMTDAPTNGRGARRPVLLIPSPRGDDLLRSDSLSVSLGLRSIMQCDGCKWPLCSQSCIGRGRYTGHSDYECETLKTCPPNYDDLDDLRDAYHALMPLRCLLLKKEDPEKWAAISAMEAHNELRRLRGDIWPNNEQHVVKRLRAWRLGFEDEEVHTICGILEVNAFEVGGSGASARALYDKAYLLAHDCTPSTTHTEAEGAPRRPLTVRAAVPHAPGALLSLCYAYTLQGTLKRREHIEHSKFFECRCRRCADPAELGTFASAFRCPRCAGRVLSTAPLEPAAPWRCVDDCGYNMPAAAVQMLLKRLTDEFEQIDANDVQGLESFLHKYRNVLANGHYLRLSVMHSLSQLYGKAEGYLIHEMAEKELHRKIDICRQLMKVFDVIEPGYSRLRGVTLYELHAPLMILTTRKFEAKAISKDELRKRLKEIVGYLSDAALILGFEPPQAAEGLMATAAKDALKKIKTWEQIIGKIS